MEMGVCVNIICRDMVEYIDSRGRYGDMVGLKQCGSHQC